MKNMKAYDLYSYAYITISEHKDAILGTLLASFLLVTFIAFYAVI